MVRRNWLGPGTHMSGLGPGTRMSGLGLGTRMSGLGPGTRMSGLGLGTRMSGLGPSLVPRPSAPRPVRKLEREKRKEGLVNGRCSRRSRGMWEICIN